MAERDKQAGWRNWVDLRLNGVEAILRRALPAYHITDYESGSVAYSPAVDAMSKGKGAQRSVQREWADLPPIQRTAGSMPQVAKPGAFVGGLPGTQGLPPVVQQLGHEVSPMAAPGLVVARVRAVEQAASSSMPAPRRSGRTAQRQAAPVAESAVPSEPEPIDMPVVVPPVTTAPARSASSSNPSSSSSVAPVVARAVATDSAVASGSGADASGDDELAADSVPAVQTTPIRSLPTVSRSAIRVPDRPLTSAAPVVRPTAQRSHAGHSHAATASDGEATPASTLPVPSGGMRRAPSSTIISRTAMPTVSRQASTPTPESAAPASAASSSPSLPALVPSGSHRAVGEPTALPAAARPIGAPPAPVVSRSTMAGPMPLATTALRPTIQRIGDGEDAGDEGPEDGPVQRSIAPAVQRTASLPALPSLPVLSVSRSARDGGPASTDGGSASLTAAGSSLGSAPAMTAPVQRTSSPTTPAIRPIAAHNPLRPALGLQRDATDDAGDDDSDADGGLPSPWWAPAAAERSAGVPSLATSGGADGGLGVQRSAFGSPAASATPVTALRGTSGGSPTWTNPSVQRSASRTTASTPKLPVAVAPTTVAAHMTASATPSATPAWGAPNTTVVFPQRQITSDPVVQTSRSGGASTPTTPTTPTVQRDPTTASSTGGASAGSSRPPVSDEGQSDEDLDKLASKLFGRIRTRLRADLLHDREAAGFTFDNV